MSDLNLKIRFGKDDRRLIEAPSEIPASEVIKELMDVFDLKGDNSHQKWVLLRASGQVLDSQKTMEGNGLTSGEELLLQPAEERRGQEKDKVPDLKDWQRCPSCGHSNPTGSDFCQNCGKRMVFLSLKIYWGERPVQHLEVSEDASVRDLLTAVVGPKVKEADWKIYDKDLGIYLNHHRSLARNGVVGSHTLHLESGGKDDRKRRFLIGVGIALVVLALGAGGTVLVRRWLAGKNNGPVLELQVSPAAVSLASSQRQQFSATLGGQPGAVTWSISPGSGAINPDGLYTAPNPILKSEPITVTATSVANPAKSASSTVTLQKTSVDLRVLPASATLNGGEAVRFNAQQADGQAVPVSWTLDPSVGTIAPDGTYTAPIPVPAASTVTATATSTVDPSVKVSCPIALHPVAISISPANATVPASSAFHFTAALHGTANQAVRWSVSGGGSISNIGMYSAPEIATLNQTATVTAISSADPSKRSRAVVKLVPVIELSVTPANASLGSGQRQEFKVQLRGASANSLKWSLDGPGNLSETGSYQAPSSIAQEQTAHIKVVSENDPAHSGSASITLRPLAVTVTPRTVEMKAGETKDFSATVLYGSSTAVRWTLAGKGTLTSEGVYTAPSVVMADSVARVTATSMAEPSRSATAEVNLKRFQGSSGSFSWIGALQRNDTVTIDDAGPSKGTLQGLFLPGVPVTINVSNKDDYVITQPPAPSNGWRRITLRSKRGKGNGVSIQWTVIPGAKK